MTVWLCVRTRCVRLPHNNTPEAILCKTRNRLHVIVGSVTVLRQCDGLSGSPLQPSHCRCVQPDRWPHDRRPHPYQYHCYVVSECGASTRCVIGSPHTTIVYNT